MKNYLNNIIEWINQQNLQQSPAGTLFRMYQGYIYVLIVFLFIVLAYQLAFMPGQRKINDLKHEISTMDIRIKTKTRTLQNDKEKNLKEQENLRILRNMVCTPQEVLTWTNTNLSKLLADSQNKLVSIQRGKQDKLNADIYYLSIDIEAQGSYKSLTNFLSQIEKQTRLIKIQSFDLSLNNSVPASLGLTASLVIYYTF